jgi:hypothetical protein
MFYTNILIREKKMKKKMKETIVKVLSCWYKPLVI